MAPFYCSVKRLLKSFWEWGVVKRADCRWFCAQETTTAASLQSLHQHHWWCSNETINYINSGWFWQVCIRRYHQNVPTVYPRLSTVCHFFTVVNQILINAVTVSHLTINHLALRYVFITLSWSFQLLSIAFS